MTGTGISPRVLMSLQQRMSPGMHHVLGKGPDTPGVGSGAGSELNLSNYADFLYGRANSQIPPGPSSYLQFNTPMQTPLARGGHWAPSGATNTRKEDLRQSPHQTPKAALGFTGLSLGGSGREDQRSQLDLPVEARKSIGSSTFMDSMQDPLLLLEKHTKAAQSTLQKHEQAQQAYFARQHYQLPAQLMAASIAQTGAVLQPNFLPQGYPQAMQSFGTMPWPVDMTMPRAYLQANPFAVPPSRMPIGVQQRFAPPSPHQTGNFQQFSHYTQSSKVMKSSAPGQNMSSDHVSHQLQKQQQHVLYPDGDGSLEQL